MKNKFFALVLSLIFIICNFTPAFATTTSPSPVASPTSKTEINVVKTSAPVTNSPDVPATTGVLTPPDNNINVAALNVGAVSAILVDQDTGRILYGKNIHQKVYPASITKLVTALVASEYIKSTDIVITGSEIDKIPWDSSKAGNKKGEALTGENLFRALIIPSGNETANVVAYNTALRYLKKTKMPWSEAEKTFTDLMDKRVKDLGGTDSNFVNPHGYQDPNHYTSAYDISLVVREDIKIPLIKQIGGEKEFSGNGAGDNYTGTAITQKYDWKSHNLLITNGTFNYTYATGLKTGFTDDAGDCVAATATKDGKNLIAIVFNSPDPGRWKDATALFDYGFNNYSTKTLHEQGVVVQELGIDNPKLGDEKILQIETQKKLTYFMRDDEVKKVERKLTFLPEFISTNKNKNGETLLKTPIKKGDVLGNVEYFLGGQLIGTDNVVASRDVLTRGLKSDVSYFAKKAKSLIFSWFIIPILLGLGLVIAVIAKILSVINGRRKRSYYNYRRRK